MSLVSTKSVAETADDRRLDPLAAQLGGHGRRPLLRELLVGGGPANAVGEAEEHHLLAAVLLIPADQPLEVPRPLGVEVRAAGLEAKGERQRPRSGDERPVVGGGTGELGDRRGRRRRHDLLTDEADLLDDALTLVGECEAHEIGSHRACRGGRIEEEAPRQQVLLLAHRRAVRLDRQRSLLAHRQRPGGARLREADVGVSDVVVKSVESS